jgi:hypothetical protein
VPRAAAVKAARRSALTAASTALPFSGDGRRGARQRTKLINSAELPHWTDQLISADSRSKAAAQKEEKIMKPGEYLAATTDVVDLHEDAMRLALLVQSKLESMKFSLDNCFARGALFSMWADACVLHQGVRALCEAGYTLGAPLLIRTLFELYLGSAVIVNAGDDADFLAFKHSCSFLVEAIRESDFPEPQRSSARDQIEELIKQLPNQLQERARTFVFKDKIRKFWYSPEFTGPGDIIEKYGKGDLKLQYRLMSASTHGGFSGMRLYKDEPDTISTSPRRDSWAQNRALLSSARLLVEFCVLRAHWDEVDDIASKFVDWFSRKNVVADRLLREARERVMS